MDCNCAAPCVVIGFNDGYQFLTVKKESHHENQTYHPLFSIQLPYSYKHRHNSSLVCRSQNRPAAFGQGEFTFNHELISFSFDTHANQTGHARGRAVFENLSTQTQVVVRIDCLRVDSFEAVITGTVLHSNDPDFPKSTDVIFAAFDGQGIRSDTITPLFVNPFSDCNAGASPLTIFQVDGIVIEP